MRAAAACCHRLDDREPRPTREFATLRITARQRNFTINQSMAFGSGFTSGRAMASPHMRQLLKLQPGEEEVCFINVGTVSKTKKPRVRPETTVFVSCL